MLADFCLSLENVSFLLIKAFLYDNAFYQVFLFFKLKKVFHRNVILLKKLVFNRIFKMLR
jgi:hypothetical protein